MVYIISSDVIIILPVVTTSAVNRNTPFSLFDSKTSACMANCILQLYFHTVLICQ